MAVFEYFPMEGEAREMVTRGASELDLRRFQRERGIIDLLGNALRCACDGMTTVDEAKQLEIAV